MLFIIFMLLCVTVEAKQIEVNTGYGYFTDNHGNISMKAELPIGKHQLDDNFNYVEVQNKEELNKIQILYVEDDQQKKDKMIQQKIRALAEGELKKEGKLDANGNIAD